TAKEGMAHDNTRSVLEARDGSLFSFCDGGGLTQLKNGTTTVYTAKEGLASNYGSTIFESRDGSIWIGTGNGLSRLQDGKITNYREGLPSQTHFQANSEDEESLLVATSNNRVYRLRNGVLSDYTVNGENTPFCEGHIYVPSVYRDPAGTMWFATTHG